MRAPGIIKTLWLVGTPSTLLVLAMISGFQPLYWLVYLISGGAVLGYLWTWVQSRGLDARVQELNIHPQVGQTVPIKVAVREKLGLPRLGLHVRLAGDFTAIHEQELSLRPRGTSTWTVPGVCHRRGLNSLGSLAIAASDPSGLLRLECRVGRPQHILVYPATVELTRATVEGQASGGEPGESGQLVGHSPVASMVRGYIPGDSMTHIHWPTTARLGHLMTKEFEGAGINEIWLFVDLQGDVQAGTGDNGTEEYSITIAASLAKGLIGAGHAVGLVAQGDQLYRLSPRKDPNHLWGLLGALAQVRAKGNTTLPSLMAHESANLGAGTVAIVVAPWPGQNMDSIFRFLARRGILVVPIFLDAASFGRLPDSRWLSGTRAEVQEWAFMVRRGEDLSATLGSVLHRLASY